MKNTIIITEGKFDSMVLDKILKNFEYELSYKIEFASGYSSALSKAKSYLSLNKKVLLVTDSDSNLKNEIIEREYFINTYINHYDESHFKSILIIPEFEIIFIENSEFTNKYLNEFKENKLLNTIKVSPKNSIEQFLNIKRDKLITLMDDPKILNEFKENKYIKDIVKFIKGI